MYLINKEKNNIEKIEEVTFKSAGFKERQHLQEWIAKNPQSLGEELLIKHPDGFASGCLISLFKNPRLLRKK